MIDFPDTHRAGITLEVRNLLTAYPADAGWVLSVALRGQGVINLTSTADGSTLVLGADATATAAWAPGRYTWAATLANGAERVDAGYGVIEVQPDLAAQAGTYDGRTHAERTLAAIEAVIEKRATVDQQAYTIAGRSLTRMSVGELFRLRDRYRQEVAQERRSANGAGGLFSQHVRVRF
jgi:hypothetical protein